MESFNELLHKLREVHERELEGWQVRVHELSNKKGCDTKRMEELFTRNQQMKEQHKVLTENIKTLENRLRAGLCDRCTVTQEVAKRRQQEYEASQMQSLQHISILAGELNNLKKENKRLKEEVRSLRAMLDHNDHSTNSTPKDVKGSSSPDVSPSAAPMALVAVPTSRASSQPADGSIAGKTEPSQRGEESLTDRRLIRGLNRAQFDTYKPVSTSASWQTEHSIPRGRTQSEGHDQRPTHHSQPLLPKNVPQSIASPTSTTSACAEVNPPRHVLHAPVPCRPQPIKGATSAFPWSLFDASECVTLAAPSANLVLQSNPKLSLSRFPNLITSSQQVSNSGPRRQAFGHPWIGKNPALSSPKEQTVLLQVKGLAEQSDGPPKVQEKKETPPSKPERVFGEGLKETYDGPLDLSDRGRSKPSETQKHDVIAGSKNSSRTEERNPDMEQKKDSPAQKPVSSSSNVNPTVSSASPIGQLQEPPPEHSHKEFNDEKTEMEQKSQMERKTEQNNDKKVPVLTISLRPVVVLETLNSSLQKEESMTFNSKSSSPAVEPEGSSEEQDEEGSASGQENIQGFKRKRASVESDTDRESDTDNIKQERKLKSGLRPEEKSPHPVLS